MIQFTALYQFSVCLVFLLLSHVSAQTVQSIVWVVPDGSLADLTQTFANGETLPLAWNAWNSTEYVDTTKNLVDLWVTGFDFALNPYSRRLAGKCPVPKSVLSPILHKC